MILPIVLTLIHREYKVPTRQSLNPNYSASYMDLRESPKHKRERERERESKQFPDFE